MSLKPFTPEFNESAIPLPEEALKFLTDHCNRMMEASLKQHEETPFLGLLAGFDMERDQKDQWIPEHLEPFYGTEFHRTLKDHQRLALNHLGWVAHYHYAVLGELMTLVYNEKCADVFQARGYNEIANYLRRESQEEREHAKTFTTIGEMIEKKYLGQPMIQKAIAKGYSLPESGFNDFGPWKATSFYYWLRGHQNIALRVREQDLQRVESKAMPVKITTAHFHDETRHYATSHVVAEAMAEMDPGCPDEVRLDWMCKLSFNGPQAGANWVWPTVQGTPGNLINETAQLLSHPMFGLTRAGVLEVMESLYLQRVHNEKWENMRERAFRPTFKLNQRVPWLPKRMYDEDEVHHTMKFDIDMGVSFARKRFFEWKERWEKGEQAAN